MNDWPENYTYVAARDREEEIETLSSIVSTSRDFLQLLLRERRIDPSLRTEAEGIITMIKQVGF